jgi:hypothetical protein
MFHAVAVDPWSGRLEIDRASGDRLRTTATQRLSQDPMATTDPYPPEIEVL